MQFVIVHKDRIINIHCFAMNGIFLEYLEGILDRDNGIIEINGFFYLIIAFHMNDRLSFHLNLASVIEMRCVGIYHFFHLK
jgi:hypothetical protein